MKKRSSINMLKGLLIIGFIIYICFKFITVTIEDENKRMPFLIIIAIILIVLAIYKLIKYLIIKSMDINYIREIPTKYSLPVVAYLYRYSVNLDSVITAMMLKLKILNLIKEADNTIYALNNPHGLNELSISEIYLYNWITAVNKDNYSFKQFKEILNKELEENGLINKKIPAHFIEYVLVCISVVVFAVLKFLGYIPEDFYIMFMAIGIIGLLISSVASDFMPYKSYQYSKKGYKEHYAVLGFYKFLKDFTNLSKRNMEEHIIWKEYLEFAVLFNINCNYETKDDYQFLTQSEIIDTIEKIGEESRD